MLRILQLPLDVVLLMCVATSVLGLESSQSAATSVELLRQFPKENLQERFLDTTGEENQYQEVKPVLVLKLLKEKLDTSPISNELGQHLVPRAVPFAVPHSAASAPEQPQSQKLEEANIEDLKKVPPKYQYIYKVKDPEGNDFGHTEARVGDRTWGQYFVQLPDGRQKTVRYWADDSGFHAEVVYTGKSPAVHQ